MGGSHCNSPATPLATLVGALNTMTGEDELSTTYPNFIRVPNSGDLLFNYRTGSSGNGVYRIARFNDTNDSWSWADRVWVANTDSSGLTYNAYPHNLSYDSNGGLHASWTYRYNSSSPTGHVGFQTNHNLFYAYSPDDGVTWYKDINGTIPYPDVIDEPNSQVIVDIPEGSSLINTGTQAVDAYDRPAIATWWAPGANDPVPDHRRQYMFVGNDGNEWFTSRITHRRSDPNTPVPETQLGNNHMGRPQIVFDDYNRAFVVYKDNDNGGGITVAYSQADSRDDWEFIKLTSDDLGYFEPTIDRMQWDSSRKLHILQQTIDGNSTNGGSPMSIVAWDTRAALGRVIHWTGADNSTWDSTPSNFKHFDDSTLFEAYDNVTFDDEATARTIDLSSSIQAGKVVVDSTGDYVFTGNGSLAAGSLSVVGGGSLNLATSNNTYSGPTRVSNATLTITGDANAMVSTIIAADQGVVVMDASNGADMASAFEVWPRGMLEIGTAESVGTVFPANPTSILNDGVIRVHQQANLENMLGQGRVEVLNSSASLQNNPLFVGEVFVGANALAEVLSADGLGGSQAHVQINAGGQLLLHQSGVYPQEVQLSGDGGGQGALQVASGKSVTLTDTVSLQGSTNAIQVGENSQLIVDRAINGSGELIKQGEGTLRLAGANTYEGETRILAGTLIVDGSTGVGPTWVQPNARLESGGRIQGHLTMEQGSILEVTPYTSLGNGVIYEERFGRDGSSPLNGLSPDTISGGEVWSAHSSILSNADGVSVASGSSATLPLEIEEGSRYVLDASFQNVSGDADWFAIGFLEGLMDGGAGNGNRFIADPTTGKAWMLFRGDNGSGPNQVLLGNDASGTMATTSWSTLNTNGGDIQMRVVLDTTAGQGGYTASFFAKLPTDVDYTQITGPLQLLSETISAVGFANSHSDVVGDVDFFRLLRESDTPVAPDAFTVEGDLTLQESALIQLDLTDPTLYDRVAVTGAIYAYGEVEVSLANEAPTPTAGDSYDLFDFTSIQGVFESLALPELPSGLKWDNSQVLSSGVIAVVDGLLGDYNDDNVVNLADYTVWRDSLGASGAGLKADGNGDLHVDELDYELWKSHFGEQLPANAEQSARVPEPNAGLLMGGFALLGGGRLARHR